MLAERWAKCVDEKDDHLEQQYIREVSIESN